MSLKNVCVVFLKPKLVIENPERPKSVVIAMFGISTSAATTWF